MNALFLKLIFAGVAVIVSAQLQAASTDWRPEQQKTVELIAAASPGSMHDRLARTMMRIIQTNSFIPSSIVVTNKQGGGGTIALALLAQNQGNPYSICTATGTLLVDHITGITKFNYTDFTLLSLLFNDYNIFSVREDSAISGGADLLSKLRSDPTSITFAFATARGNYNHMAITRLARAANVDINLVRTVVYNGGGQAATAVLGGHVDVLVGGPANIVGQVEARQLRGIAVSAPQRFSKGVLASVPTWREQGVDIVADNPYFMLGAKDIPPEQIAFWEQLFAKVVQTPEWVESAEQNYWTPFHMSRTDATKYLDAQCKEYTKTLTMLGLVK